MTANKVYYPAFIGGEILGVQMEIQNTGATDVSCSPSNGVYYTYDGRDYQILSLRGLTLTAGVTTVKAEDKVQALIPNSDVKIMVDTAGLEDCVVKVTITWGVA